MPSAAPVPREAFELVLQQGELLGDRLHHVLSFALTHGYDQAAVLSADTPFVKPDDLMRGFVALDEGADMSIGPCDDGGWYVMHLREPHPELLVPIAMSTPQTFQDTLAAAQRANLRTALLPMTTDVDTPDDLTKILEASANMPAHVAQHTRTWLPNGNTHSNKHDRLRRFRFLPSFVHESGDPIFPTFGRIPWPRGHVIRLAGGATAASDCHQSQQQNQAGPTQAEGNGRLHNQGKT